MSNEEPVDIIAANGAAMKIPATTGFMYFRTIAGTT